MLAIVIPFYNIEYFEATLHSLKNQKDKRFKVYIGNDGSLNDPKDIIDSYKNELAICYKEFKQNIGQHSLVSHWNRCVDLVVKEEWILILGDDDVLAPNCVASFYKHLGSIEVQKCNVVRFASQLINAEGRVQSEIFQHPKIESSLDSFKRYFLKQTRSSLSEHIFRKSALQQYGFEEFPLAWFSDTKALLDFAENKPLYSINEAIAYIRKSAVNISGKESNMPKKYLAAYFFYKSLLSNRQLKLDIDFKNEIFKEFENYVVVTRNYSLENWRIIGWNALKKLDLITLKKITLKTIKNLT